MKKILNFNKKLFTSILCFSFIVTSTSILGIFKVYADNITYYVTGIEGSAFIVSSNDGSKNGKIYFDGMDGPIKNYQTFILKNNITIDEPISKFYGILDGNGYTITLNYNNDKSNVGVFKKIEDNTTVKNLIINANVSGKSNVGGLAGQINDNVNIENITINGTVKGESNVGGLAGKVDGKNTKIINITNNSNVSSEEQSGFSEVGGIVGYIDEGSISGSTNNGIIKGTGKDVGGLVGNLESATIDNSTNNGEVNGRSYVGGLVGNSNNSKILGNTSNNGNIKGTVGVTGGIVGRSISGTEINGPINTGFIEGCVDGYTTFNSDGSDGACYTGGIVGAAYRTTINNVQNISDITVKSVFGRVGGIAGQVSDASNINDSSNEGKIIGDSADFLGGIAGYADGGSGFNNLTNSGDITGAKKLGGIVGYSKGKSWIYSSTNNGKVVSIVKSNNTNSYTGGITGYAESVDIKKSTNNADITANGNYVGGIVGATNEKASIESILEDDTNNGKIVSDSEVDSSYVGGIIGYTKNANLSNVYNKNSVYGKGYVGGIVAFIEDGKITNSYNASGDELISSSGSNVNSAVGGIAAKTKDTSIENAVNIGRISADSGSSDGVGGIIGYAHGEKQIRITNSQNENLVTSGEKDGKSMVGGIVGNADSRIVVENANNKGEVNGDGTHTGGIVGRLIEASTIHNSSNEGKIKGSNYTGGIAGGIKGSTVKNVINKTSVSGGSNVGGIVGYTEGSTAQSVLNVTEDISGNSNVGLIFGGTNGLTIDSGAYTLKENSKLGGYADGTPKINSNGRVQGYTAEELKQDKVKNENTNNEEKSTYEGFDFNSTWKMNDNYADLQLELTFDFIEDNEEVKDSYTEAKKTVSSGSVGGSSNGGGNTSSSNSTGNNSSGLSTSGSNSSSGTSSSGNNSSSSSSSSSSSTSGSTSSSSSSSTTSKSDKEEDKIVTIKIQVDGSNLDIDNYLYNDGRTFVDVSTFCEKTNKCKVELINDTNIYEITRTDNLLNNENGEYTYLVEHEPKSKVYKSSIIIGGRKINDDENSQTATDVESCPSGGSIECDKNKFFVPIRFLAQALGYKVEWDGDNDIVKIESTFEKDFNEKFEISIVEGKCDSNINDCTVIEKNSNDAYEVYDGKEYYMCVSDKTNGDVKTFSKYFSFYDEIEQEGDSEPYTYIVSPFQISSNKLVINKSSINVTTSEKEISSNEISSNENNTNNQNTIVESKEVSSEVSTENSEKTTTLKDEINIAQIVIYKINATDEEYNTNDFNSGSYPFVVNAKFTLQN